MKKTLLSVLAGVAVIGSAFAVPTPEDRKTLCEKHPDKYVWVEKTQACVPINPCKSENATIKNVYCVEIDVFSFPKEPERLSLLLNRWAEKVLKSGVSDKRELDDGYIALVTLDAGYHVINPIKGYDYAGTYVSRFQEAIGPALWAYGYERDDLENIDIDHWLMSVKGNITKTECDDIRDFASLLGDYIFDSKYEDGKCWIADTVIGRYKK